MLNFFKKKKCKLNMCETVVIDKSQDTRKVCEEPKTLGDLAKSGHSFFRFSQSQPGRSIEKVYAEYIPGKITEAKDKEKYLSFVTDETIAICFMYGDMLTSLKFDLNDELFKKIADTPFKYIGNTFGEYESRYLLVDNNYSLEDVNTIVMLFNYVTSTKQLHIIFGSAFDSLEQRLHDYKYFESEKLVKYLKSEYNKNIHISPEEIKSLIKKYMNK